MEGFVPVTSGAGTAPVPATVAGKAVAAPNAVGAGTSPIPTTASGSAIAETTDGGR